MRDHSFGHDELRAFFKGLRRILSPLAQTVDFDDPVVERRDKPRAVTDGREQDRVVPRANPTRSPFAQDAAQVDECRYRVELPLCRKHHPL